MQGEVVLENVHVVLRYLEHVRRAPRPARRPPLAGHIFHRHEVLEGPAPAPLPPDYKLPASRRLQRGLQSPRRRLSPNHHPLGRRQQPVSVRLPLVGRHFRLDPGRARLTRRLLRGISGLARGSRRRRLLHQRRADRCILRHADGRLQVRHARPLPASGFQPHQTLGGRPVGQFLLYLRAAPFSNGVRTASAGKAPPRVRRRR
mmetsp:Transcript_1446/g.3887  ORF Transcript_1446/g.3887 Transcript_1446/m.3887 type:complete len:203 (-) Transcript_1446:73-681(-)